MPPIQDLLERFRTGAQGPSRFAKWPPAPPVKPVPFRGPQAAVAAAAQPLGGGELNPQKYQPAIVIGLGAAGEQVLRMWLAQMAQDAAGRQVNLHAVLLTPRPTAPLPAEHLQVQQFALSAARDSPVILSLPRPRCRRDEIQNLFRQHANYAPLLQHLVAALISLHADVRVLVVASLAEPSVALLGEVLQVLRLAEEQAGKTSLTLNVSAFLAWETPDAADVLDPGESYAALREIGRFTFGGLHQVEPLPGAWGGVVRSAMLDHIFLIEAHGSIPDFHGTPFEHGVGQALAEALFTFLHPCGGTLWEHIANASAGKARSQAHEAVTHSFGIATLEVPLSALRDYVAARLACAALYGEREDVVGEGLLETTNAAADYTEAGERLARRWLTTGPCAHPLFEWLLDVNIPAALRSLPRLTEDFAAAFQAQLAHGLADLLNNPSERPQMAQAQAAVDWLNRRFETFGTWFNQAATSDPYSPERLAFQALLRAWRATLTSLAKQITAWQRAAYPARPADRRGAQPARVAAAITAGADWRTASASLSGPQAAVSLPDLMRARLHAAERAVTEAGRGRIRRALTANKQDELREAAAYYADTIRPELSTHGLGNSAAFTRIRERLRWWVNLAPGREPEMLLICLPPGGQAALAPPPDETRFAPGGVEAFSQAVLWLAHAQASGLAADLSGEWLRQRLNVLAPGFLQRAATPFLAYDENAAAARPFQVAQHSYVIARDKSLTGAYKTMAFPDVAPFAINELDGGEAVRITALRLRFNIPLETTQTARAAYTRYLHQERYHLYPQERTASTYERRIRAILGGKLRLLPPDLTLALAEGELATLFCQALFCRLIDVRRGELGQNPEWTVLPPDEGFAPLTLASADHDGLWHAFRAFTLELPNDPAVEHNPTNHFSQNRREEFKRQLRAAAQACRQRPEFKQDQADFEASHLAAWRRRGERDPLARAFADLLTAELDKPVWKDWYG